MVNIFKSRKEKKQEKLNLKDGFVRFFNEDGVMLVKCFEGNDIINCRFVFDEENHMLVNYDEINLSFVKKDNLHSLMVEIPDLSFCTFGDVVTSQVYEKGDRGRVSAGQITISISPQHRGL